MAGPVGAAVAQGGQHVAAQRVRVEVPLVHGVDHVRRDQHGHGGALADVALDVLRQRVGEQPAQRLLQLAQVLDRVLALPGGVLPLRLRDGAVARQPPPVRLRVRALQGISEGLLCRLLRDAACRCRRLQSMPPAIARNTMRERAGVKAAAEPPPGRYTPAPCFTSRSDRFRSQSIRGSSSPPCSWAWTTGSAGRCSPGSSSSSSACSSTSSGMRWWGALSAGGRRSGWRPSAAPPSRSSPRAPVRASSSSFRSPAPSRACSSAPPRTCSCAAGLRSGARSARS